MINDFFINGNLWKVRFVFPNSRYLVDRTDELRVATTDPNIDTIFLSMELHGELLRKVLIHEITHVILWEYQIIQRIHKYCKPMYRIAMEEEICNVLAEYGEIVFQTAYRVMGGEAIFIIPQEMERLIA